MQQRASRALEHRDLAAVGHLEDLQRIGRRDVPAAVAGDRRDAKNLDLW
jgi:hypothetical protein